MIIGGAALLMMALGAIAGRLGSHPFATCEQARQEIVDLVEGLPVVVEDCGIEHDEIAATFDEEVATLVDGVTKLSTLALPSSPGSSGEEEVQAENLRKMFIAMGEDVRVVIVKLAR